MLKIQSFPGLVRLGALQVHLSTYWVHVPICPKKLWVQHWLSFWLCLFIWDCNPIMIFSNVRLSFEVCLTGSIMCSEKFWLGTVLSIILLSSSRLSHLSSDSQIWHLTMVTTMLTVISPNGFNLHPKCVGVLDGMSFW